MTDDEATVFLGKFAGQMSVPIHDGWRGTGLFKESGMAPEASQGDIKKLVDTIVGWSEEEPEWLA